MKTPQEIYHQKNATKAELRYALGSALGIAQEEPEAKTESLFTQCCAYFQEQYRRETGLAYNFSRRDGVALAEIIKKLENVCENKSILFLSFQALIAKLPDWYKKNQFTLPGINSGFNSIILQIRKQNGNISDSYKERVLRDLFA